MWDDIYKPNSIGSEGGTIIADAAMYANKKQLKGEDAIR